MEKSKRFLLSSSICMFIYIIFELLFIFLTKDKDYIMNTIFISVSLIGAILFLYLSLTKKSIDKYKPLIIIFSIFLFISNIFSGVLGFIAASNLNKRKKRELPKIEILNNTKWYIHLIIIIIYILLTFILPNYYTKTYQYIISYLIVFTMLIYIFRKDLIRDFKLFKEYFREYMSFILKTYGKSLVVMAILSISIRLSTGIVTATNQKALTDSFNSKPVMIALLAIIFAPITEELVFRGLFRKYIKKEWLFILLSGFVFGAAHVIDDFQSVGELLYILVYSSLGCFLAYTYYKTNNIYANIFFHFLQNSFAIIALILLYFLPVM